MKAINNFYFTDLYFDVQLNIYYTINGELNNLINGDKVREIKIS